MRGLARYSPKAVAKACRQVLVLVPPNKPFACPELPFAEGNTLVETENRGNFSKKKSA